MKSSSFYIESGGTQYQLEKEAAERRMREAAEKAKNQASLREEESLGHDHCEHEQVASASMKKKNFLDNIKADDILILAIIYILYLKKESNLPLILALAFIFFTDKY